MKTMAMALVLSAVCAGMVCAEPTTETKPATAAAPDSTAVMSKPVEVNGLQMTVSLPKASFTEAENVRFTVTYKNVSKEAFVLEDADWLWNQTVQFEDFEKGGPWVPALQIMIKRSPTTHVLKAGETFEFTEDYATEKMPLLFEWNGAQKKPVKPIPHLNAGKYRLKIALNMLGGAGKDGVKPWAGKIAAEPVEFEITKSAALKFDTYGGYFVSNKFEPNAPSSYVVLHDQKAFDEVFGVAMVMGDRSHRLAKDAFDSNLVIGVVKRDRSVWIFKVNSVTVSDGVLKINYDADAPLPTRDSDATFATPLIVSVPKGEFSTVEFIENGKAVKKSELKK